MSTLFRRPFLSFSLFALGVLTACVSLPNIQLAEIDLTEATRQNTLTLLQELSSDDMAGRGVGTAGHTAARKRLLAEIEQLGLQPRPGATSYQQPFVFGDFAQRGSPKPTRPGKQGINLIGVLPGALGTDSPILAITAHYDHLGVREGQIYNGADDNASGVAGMLAIAAYFKQNPPQHSIWFIAFDAEESGFIGARHFMRTLDAEAQSRLALNLNLDMISRGDNGILWASGAAHWPKLKPLIRAVAKHAPVTLKQGFDTGEGFDNWTELSDHVVFYQAGIPHVYLGVEDHPDYHKPSDDFELIDTAWFLDSVRTALMIAVVLESHLTEIAPLQSQ